MKDFYLLDDGNRVLLNGMDGVTPIWEFDATREITASSRSASQTVSVSGELTRGNATVTLLFANDDGDDEGDRNLRLDRLVVRDAGRVVSTHEIEDLPAASDCNHPVGDHFGLHCTGGVDVPVTLPANGRYEFEVTAWADQYGDEAAKLEIAVGSDPARSAGARIIKAKLAELHSKLLGVDADGASPDVQAAFDLFVEVWRRGRESGIDDFRRSPCRFHSDIRYLDGVIDDHWLPSEDGDLEWNWDRVSDLIWRETDMSDPQQIASTWVVVLAYLMTDPRYLHL